MNSNYFVSVNEDVNLDNIIIDTSEKTKYKDEYEEDKSLLEYPNKKVPRYVLYQSFYKINNIIIGNSKEELDKIKFLEKK